MLISVPIGYDWKPKALFVSPLRLKSHDFKICLYDGILKFCLRNLPKKNQRSTIFRLCDTTSKICSEKIILEELCEVEAQVHEVLALLERDFPVSLHVVVFHLLHHLPKFLKQFGPVYSFWMFPFERFNSWISQRVTNRRYPESTVIATYRLFELSCFLDMIRNVPCGSVEKDDQPSSSDSPPATCTLDEAQLSSLRDYLDTVFLEYHHLSQLYEKKKLKLQQNTHYENFRL